MLSKSQSPLRAKTRLIVLICTLICLIAVIIAFFVFNRTTSNEDFTIVNNSSGSNCAMAIEEFYRDEEYIYSFPCIMSDEIQVIFYHPTRHEEDLKTALRESHIKIEDLDRFNITYRKEPITNSSL